VLTRSLFVAPIVVLMLSTTAVAAQAAPPDKWSPSGPPIPCAGGQLVKPNPPSQFDPATADNSQLRQFGYPPRPTDPAELATWTHFINNPIDWGDSCDVVNVPSMHSHAPTSAASGTTTSFNWTGYQDVGKNYLDAEAHMAVPGGFGPNGSGDVHWVGVGDGTSKILPIVQAGTGSTFDCCGHNTAFLWWEVWPDNGMQKVTFSVIPGEDIYIEIVFTINHEQERIVDLNEGFDHTYVQTLSAQPDGTAEFISERQTISKIYVPLANYGTMNYYNAAVSTGSGFYAFATDSPTLISPMTEDGVQRAHTGAINQTTHEAFTTYWDNYGNGDPCGC
jgi:hypothetical protein